MIDFNTNDFNLRAIKIESKLFNLITKFKYRVYGLRQEENPALMIEFNTDAVSTDKTFTNRVQAVIDFLKSNGIEAESYGESDDTQINIGLRRDLRSFVNKNKEPILSASVLSTIIYCLEGRIDIEQLKKFKLAAIPKLPEPAALNEIELVEEATA